MDPLIIDTVENLTMPIGDILNIAKLGLLAHQGSLKVVSHNIANVNTPGFSRQSASLSSVAAANTAVNSSGDGVTIALVRRQVDTLVERRLNVGERELGRLDARNRYLPIVERAFNDMDGDGLGGRMEQFFAAADKLAENATNPVGRTELVVEADNLARYANEMYTTLSEVTLPVDNEISLTMDDINNRLLALRDINMEITKQESAATPALDLKDQRQQMLNELGRKIDILALDQPDGGVSVMTTSGKLLVDHTYAASFSREQPLTDTQFLGIHIDERNEDISGQIVNGELRGLLEVRDEIIHGEPALNGQEGWLYRLNKLVGELRWQANLANSQAVGKEMMTSQRGVFDLGNDMAAMIDTLDLDLKSATYDGSPPDMDRVQTGVVTIAYGNDMDNLSTTTININPATMSLNNVQAALNASPAFAAAFDAQNHLTLTAKASYYGVVSDTSGVMAAMGVGAIFGGRNALEMAVNDELVNDSNMVGAAHIAQDGGVYQFDNGNNEGALALGALRSAMVDPMGQNELATFAAHYGQMVGELGSVKQRDETTTTAHQAEQDFILGVRESVSGVSLEEELTGLIRFQRAFQASGKMVTSADELLQSVLNMV